MAGAEPSSVDDRVSELQRLTKMDSSWPHAQSPISRLSPELLIEIIWFWIEGVTPWSRASEYDWKIWVHALVQATHVCRSWRDVTLSYPMFWDTIFIARPDCMHEWLVRSKQTPLVIIKSTDTSLSDVEEIESYRLVLEHISRIRKIQLFATPHVIQALSSSGWADLSAPLLESVDVFPSPIDLDDRNLDPRHFVSRNAPRLKQLDLGLYEVVTWTNVQLPSTLTRFSISGIFSTESLDALFSAVETLMELQHVQFHLGLEEEFPIRPHKYILSPHLKAFSLHNRFEYPNSVADFAPLLDCFSFRPTTSILVGLELVDPEPSFPIRALAASVAMALHGDNGPAQPILSLTLRFTDPGEFSLDAWSSPQPPHSWAGAVEKRDSPRLSVWFIWGRLQYVVEVAEAVQALFEDLCPALPLRDVQTLALTFDFRDPMMTGLISGLTMRWTFGGMPSLKTIYIATLSGKELLRFLAGANHEPLLQDVPTIFPSLVALHLKQVEFVGPELSVFMDWLRARQAAGAGITALTLRTCDGVGTEDVELFKTLVAEVQYETAPQQSSSFSTTYESSSP